ncbi:MAG: leucine-rich repeat domain-containing protein, partial [Clostridiales bacterium]|nr:leucine-rich repeat domain-containing protein [Clostridiales bacterium]
YPGIGGASGGTIIINGGNVTATGSTSGAMNNIPRSSPGIGGSSSSGAIVTINGGVVHAIGGTQAAAIGSGTFAPDGASTVTIGNGMKVTVKGAAAPVLAGDRVNACAENDVTVAPCGHDAEVIFSPTAEMNCTRCSLTGPYPAYGNGTSDNPWKIRTALRVSELPSGWYEVTESTDYENRISVNGSVNLILGEGTTLDASHGIHVTGENALIISGSGTLNATAPNSPDDRESWGCAGIGGNQGEDGGFLIINSGSVKATGSVFGAGIGGGSNGGNGGNITINGGMVTAGFDGAYNEEAGLAAAIGGGDTGSGGIILITGGAVRAEGRRGSAGIGGGGYGSGGTITITGGFVTAIGASYPNGRSAAGIGAGRVRNKATSGDSGNITITGGTVIAVGGENAQAIGVSNEVAENDSGTLILGRSLVVTAGESESTAVVATDDLLAACRSPWVKVEFVIPAFGEPDFILPGFLTTVGEKAFEGTAMQIVLVQASCTAIGNYAFRNCMNLTEIRIPDGCTIGTDAFDGCPLVFVYGTADDSPAKKYCDTHENCVFVKETQN